MRRITTMLLLCLALLAPAAVAPTPALAHMDHWHQATCNPQGGQQLYYNIPSWAGGSRITYWRYIEGYTDIDQPFLQPYAASGYECGWMGQVTNNASIHTICEFGYCGTGIEQYLQRARMLRHYGGPNAGQVVVYNR